MALSGKMPLRIKTVSIFGDKTKMSFQGKQLSADMVETIVRLKKHFDEERKNSKFVSTIDSAKRTAMALGIGVATVKRTMSNYYKSGEKVVVHIKTRPGRPPTSICPDIQPGVRQFIRSENLNGQRVSFQIKAHRKVD